MGEYSNAVLDLYSDRKPYRNYFGISSVSPCPKETYLNYVAFRLYHDEGVGESPSRTRSQVMDDGHYQESAVINILRRAGYIISHVGKDQVTVTVGESKIQGHPDGFIRPADGGNNWRMQEIKARNYASFKLFREQGLKAFPRIRCQVQLYLASEGLPYDNIEECAVIFKHKETALMEDTIETKDEDYSKRLIESLDDIFIREIIPESVERPMCKGCQYASLCWQGEILDFSGIEFRPELKEASEKWVQGKGYITLGEEMVEDARKELLESMGDNKEEMITDTLKVLRSSYYSRRFNKKMFIQENSEAEYDRYCIPTPVNNVRISLL